MKIINEKGKLFGLVNIIDLITILLIIALVLGALYKFKGNSINMIGSNKTKEMEYVVRLNPNYEDFFKQINVGDKLVQDKRVLDASITDIKIQDFYESIPDENGEVSIQKHPLFKEAFITIKATVSDKDPIFKLGEQEIRVGCSNFVRTKLFEMSGFIYKVIE
ncbi:hypothetical protein SH1V18_29270 [Vallitalea longa]|uniref:DUF4330 domain-containing protein n=1 Tax=Vallitalea longa TaxID=2936439 RepID=A0A9W5YBI3_9FIRM|nr:DUF4330 domain-containing protein [Vallitalea longa]GKX30447.1 hypothetical protein SH1V18_29270 [Vallitalea longa]